MQIFDWLSRVLERIRGDEPYDWDNDDTLSSDA